MHDDLIERRLRDTLRSEGDGLAFTITPSELERRLALRRRRHAFRPAGLLLAAAVGIGLVGVAGLVGGWFEQRPDSTPAPSTLAVVRPSPSAEPLIQPPASAPAPAPADLPTIEDLAHAGPIEDIVVAQASGPGEAPLMPDVRVTHPSTMDLGPVPAGRMEVQIACLTKDGTDDARFGMATAEAPPSETPQDVLGCDGSVLHSTYTVDEPSVLRLALPGSASWRVVVRAADGVPATTASLPATPVAGPGEEVLIDRSFHPIDKGAPLQSFDTSSGTGLLGPPVLAGEIKFRDRYVIRASCAGSPAMAHHVGSFDPTGPSLPDSTTLVPCDGAVHEMVWRPGDRPNSDVFVTAPEGTAWRLLVTADPSPLTTAPDGDGWTEAMSSSPRFVADDLSESFVGRLTGKNTVARVVVSCQGGTSVDVSVSRGDQTGSLQRFTAPCGDQATTTTGEPFVPDENGGFTVETDPHGRMWTAITIQQAPPSAAP